MDEGIEVAELDTTEKGAATDTRQDALAREERIIETSDQWSLARAEALARIHEGSLWKEVEACDSFSDYCAEV